MPRAPLLVHPFIYCAFDFRHLGSLTEVVGTYLETFLKLNLSSLGMETITTRHFKAESLREDNSWHIDL